MLRTAGVRALSVLPGAARGMCTAKKPGFFELRQYELKPEGSKTYLDVSKHSMDLRKSIFNTNNSHWLAFFSTEVGSSLNRVHHLYHFDDYDARDAARKRAATDHGHGWLSYLKAARPHMLSQQSTIFVEATDLLKAAGLPGALGFKSPEQDSKGGGSVAYELRTYQLQLGYNCVPDFLKLYGEGLPDKLHHDQSGASTLVTLLYSDGGPLNKVIEIWRHESMQRSVDSRVASRGADKWKAAIAGIAKEAISFENQFLRPTAFSEWK